MCRPVFKAQAKNLRQLLHVRGIAQILAAMAVSRLFINSGTGRG
jgi:hypothetical protein